MPKGVDDRDVVQYVRRLDDLESKTTTMLYRNAPVKIESRKGVVRCVCVCVCV